MVWTYPARWMAMVETLVLGRQAIGRRAWDEAMQAFTDADREEDLSPEDLELMAEAAWWAGRPDEAVEAMERAYAGYLEAGERLAAAMVAMRLFYLAARRLAQSIANGWLARAERLLEHEPESVEHAWLSLCRTAAAIFLRRDLDGALTQADAAVDLGRKYASADVQSLAMSFKGALLIKKGQWEEGLALIDEAAASAVSGELELRWASDVYCTTIAACRDMADYRRAGEWTDEAERWMRRRSLGGYPGVCRVHRAELKRLRGAWPEAEQEARQACEELERYRLLDGVGFAHYQVGEVRLRMGDLTAAEQAFRRAYEFGAMPQPGLALLMLTKGDVEEAARSIQGALAYGPAPNGEPGDVVGRAWLLPAQVEIALARNDLDTARAAAEQLEQIAQQFPGPVL